jgi:hypothetical protein
MSAARVIPRATATVLSARMVIPPVAVWWVG